MKIIKTVVLAACFILFPLLQQATAQIVFHTEKISPHFMLQKVLSDGAVLDKHIISGPPKPPAGYESERVPVDLSVLRQQAGATTSLAVPAYTWIYGCSSVSAAMAAAYYDRNGFPDMYTGDSNGGVMPMNNIWGTFTDTHGDTYELNPLIASRNGLDDRMSRGSLDDYWVYYESGAADPYITNFWQQHAWADAIGDYMKTSQSAHGNGDGSTTFYTWDSEASPLTCSDMVANNIADADGAYGIKLFYEARGYSVGACYNQPTSNKIAGGFSLVQFKSEINAGRPVILQLEGHTVLGVGYDLSNNVYFNDTWDTLLHAMPWGGSYSGMALHAVTFVVPVSTSISTSSSSSSTSSSTSTAPTTSSTSSSVSSTIATTSSTSIPTATSTSTIPSSTSSLPSSSTSTSGPISTSSISSTVPSTSTVPGTSTTSAPSSVSSTTTSVISACIDSDHDSYGENCPAGADCDDNDPFYTGICPDCEVNIIPGASGWFFGDAPQNKLLLVIGGRDTVFTASTPVRWESEGIMVLNQHALFKRFMLVKVRIDPVLTEQGEQRVLVGTCSAGLHLMK